MHGSVVLTSHPAEGNLAGKNSRVGGTQHDRSNGHAGSRASGLGILASAVHAFDEPTLDPISKLSGVEGHAAAVGAKIGSASASAEKADRHDENPRGGTVAPLTRQAAAGIKPGLSFDPLPDYARPPAPLSAFGGCSNKFCRRCGNVMRRCICLLTAASGHGRFDRPTRGFALSSAVTAGEPPCSFVLVQSCRQVVRVGSSGVSPAPIRSTKARRRFDSTTPVADILLAPWRASNFSEVG